jgi:hypothetical protein
VEVETYVEEGQVQSFKDWMTDLTNGKCVIKEGDLVYLEEKVQN